MTRIKSQTQRLIGVVLALLFTCTLASVFTTMDAYAICCRKDGFDKSRYEGKLTDSIAKNVGIIAASQDGRNRKAFGYTEDWCDEFAADCLELAGAGSLSPHGGTVQDYYNKLVNKGAKKVSKSAAKVGDLAFSVNSSSGNYGHVEIIYQITDGVIYTVGGNIYKVTGYDCTGGVCYKRNKTGMNYFTINTILHPNYESLEPIPGPGPGPDIIYENISKGTYFLKNVATGTYLTVDGAKAANGQNLSVAAKKDTNAFKFYTAGGTDNFLCSMLDNSFVVNPYADSPKAGTNATLYKKDSSGTQIWNFEKVGSNYVIKLKCDSSLALSVNGTNAQLASLNTSDTKQQWVLESANQYVNITKGTYFLKNASTGTYLTVDGAKAANGQNLSVAAVQDTNAFRFYTAGGIDNYLCSMIDNSFVVNPYADSPKAGTNATLYKKDSSGTQVWNFEKVGSNYVITLKCNSSLALAADGSNALIATLNKNDAKQQWSLETTPTSLTTTTILTTTTTTTTTAAPVTTTTESIVTTSSETVTSEDVQTTTTVTESDVPEVTTTTTEKEPEHGDLNGDGQINLKDVVMLRRYIAGGWNVVIDEELADVNGDGAVNLKDVVLMRRYIAGGWNVTLL